jgi:4,5:9,10-diseco-3-hydroxy-5,9,17-trioxoandrosta-1(10),2-diene-4-oate hydrolase
MNKNLPNDACTMRSGHATVGKRQIAYTELGHGPVVLMLHGGGPGASGIPNYARNVQQLAAHFRVIVPDMPGYGASTKGIDRLDPFGDLAGAMFGLLDALGVERAHLIGNSLGGACAMRMALDQPERVERLILMGPGGVNMSRSEPTAGLKRLLGYYAGEGPSIEKLRAFILGDLVFDASQVPDAVVDERFQASIDPEVVANPPLMGPITDPTKVDFLLDPRLSECPVPTLVLWGTEDRVNPASGANLLQQAMPHCDQYLFSGTGHWVQWERAAEFNAVATVFLQQAHPVEAATS